MSTAELIRSCESLPQPAVRAADSWRHQLQAYHFAWPQPASMLALGMGCGKSKVAVDLACNEPFPLTLIVCPVSVLGVWRREFKRWAATETEVVVLDSGTIAQKTQHADRCLTLAKSNGRPLVLVANYETVWRDPLATWLMQKMPQRVILDESHRAKSPAAKNSRYLSRLGARCRRRLCLTGTPMPHSPMDIYAQMRFLVPGKLWKTAADFRAAYGIPDPLYPSKVRRWVNLDKLQTKLDPFMFRVRSEDVLDLPGVMHEERFVHLTPAVRRLYDNLETELVAEHERGMLSAANALVKGLRLQQITSGFAPLEKPDGEESITPLGDWKADALYDLLEDLPTEEPVVVFCRFRHDLNAVMEAAARTDRRYGELSGRRRDLTPDATMPANIDLLGVQIQSGGVGIDLTRACYCVFYSQTWSNGEYEQAVARLNRPGQTRPVRYYHLLAVDTIDEKMRFALAAKRDVVESVLAGLLAERK